MQKNRLIEISSLLFAFILFSGVAYAYDDATTNKAEIAYGEGFRLLQQERWQDALDNLRISYDQIPLPITAYLISYAYSRGGDASNALKYANKAIKGDPPLEMEIRKDSSLQEPYISESKRIIAWAQDYRKTVKIYEGAADVSTQSPPSGLKMPSASGLPRAGKAPMGGGAPSHLSGIYTVRQKSNGRYVDAHEGKNDNSLVTRERQDNDTQRWIFTPAGKNTYTLQQKSNGRYVDAHEGKNDNSLVTRERQDNDTQKWVLIPVGKNTYTIQQKSNGRYVDAHEGKYDNAIVTRDRQNNDTQKWIIR